MKQCSSCLQNKPEDSYHKQTRVSGGLQSICKDCRKNLDAKLYKKNKKRRLIRARIVRHERQKWNIELKDGKECTDCRRAFPYYVLHWDHITNDKVTNVSKMIMQACSKEKILKEIAKCELVCANCHAERTFNRTSKG
jgi:hypothetical protein